MVTWAEGITQAIGMAYVCQHFTKQNALDACEELWDLLPLIKVMPGFSWAKIHPNLVPNKRNMFIG
jgi:hypothetical protein